MNYLWEIINTIVTTLTYSYNRINSRCFLPSTTHTSSLHALHPLHIIWEGMESMWNILHGFCVIIISHNSLQHITFEQFEDIQYIQSKLIYCIQMRKAGIVWCRKEWFLCVRLDWVPWPGQSIKLRRYIAITIYVKQEGYQDDHRTQPTGGRETILIQIII